MSLEGREEPNDQTDIDRRFADIIWSLDPSFTVPDTPAPVEPSKNDRGEADAVPDELRDELSGQVPDELPDDWQDAPDQPAAGSDASSPLAGLPAQWRMPPDGAQSFLDDEDDDFVPAPPQPLPSGDDLGFWTMAGCLIGGPAWLLYLFFFDRYAQSMWWVLACALFVAGVVQLIMRSPKNRDDLDDDDDGAVL